MVLPEIVAVPTVSSDAVIVTVLLLWVQVPVSCVSVVVTVVPSVSRVVSVSSQVPLACATMHGSGQHEDHCFAIATRLNGAKL